jgi:uncharacterized protein (DUF58 family)
MGAPAIVPSPDDLNRLRNLNLIARWVVEGFIAGLHRSPYHGYSAEFMEYREYTPGEDLRYLDWKVYGRSDRTYTKRFRSETNLRASILLDTSSSMAYTIDGRDKLAYAKALAACLIYLLQRQGDAAGLATFSQSVHVFRQPRATARHRQELFSILEAIKPAGRTSFRPVRDELAERLGTRSLVVLLSDFYGDPEEIAAAFRHLRFKRHEVLAFHLVDPSEESLDFDGLLSMIDLETGTRLQVDPALVREAYVRRFRDHVSRLHTVAGDCLVDHQVLRTDTPFADALAAYLNRRAQARR